MTFVRPWLQKLHPNFFIIFVITIVRQLWSAANGFFNPHIFDGPAYSFTNEAASPKVWAVATFVSAVLMGVGLFRSTFTMARTGLAVGLVVSLAQLVFLARAQLHGIPTGNGLPNFVLIAGQFFVTTLEPPSNPVSASHGS